MALTHPSSVDLRTIPAEFALGRVEHALRVRLDRATVVRKRRTIGGRTVRATWVRIERRPFARISGQGWNGTECAALLEGVAQPAWRAAVSWRDEDATAMWRADETELLPGLPVTPGGVLTDDPGLPSAWWAALHASLDAIAAAHTTRIATPDTVTITQRHVDEVIRAAFPNAPDTTIGQWAPAHADLNWANVTGPRFCLFDWEDWGTAPRGLDSASLWAQSLAVPALADRVRQERAGDLGGRDGRVMMLFTCAKIAGPAAHPQDPRLAPARRVAERVMSELHSD